MRPTHGSPTGLPHTWKNGEKSFVVGDRLLDIQMGHQVGARSVLVLTGFGQEEWEWGRAAWQQQPDHVSADAYEAVRWILQHL